jgi:MPBQ/MSBQ methyltransferase
MVIACWCQREAGVNGAPPLSPKEQEDLNFLYEEWAHPFFISIQEFCRLMQVRHLGNDNTVKITHHSTACMHAQLFP